MKRFILSLFLLTLGAILGGGGLYLGLNWRHYFRDKTGIAAKAFLTKLRSACANEGGLHGAYIKSADVQDGKLILRGWAADKEQLAKLQTMGKTLLDEHPDLKAQCDNGVSFDALKVIPLLGMLGPWQHEFAEFKGAEKDTPDHALKREIMRTTRLDGIAFDEEGKLIVSGVCIRGDKKIDTTKTVLHALLQSRIEAAGVTPDLMPETEMHMLYRPNPATTIQRKLSNVAGAKDVRVISAYYDGKGKLHLEAIVTDAEQRKFIDEALNAFLAEPTTLAIMASPANKEAVPDFVLREVTVGGELRTAELQKKLVEHARKANKPLLRQVRFANVVPTVVMNEKKEAVTDDEGNPTYFYRVTGRLLELPGAGKKVESDLEDWLADELPRVLNANQAPIEPKLDVVVRASPVVALQERAVQRGLDGVAFTDALYDAEGKLEITGRLHQPGDEAKQSLEAAVKDLLADEAPWTFAALAPHEASKDGTPIAWSAAVRECRARLASDSALGRRVRLDRLYFSYVEGQLRLVSDGVFLADTFYESPAAALVKSVDAAIVSRGKTDVSVANLKAIKNPLVDLQNLLSERAELDGALLTHLRYDADGRLQLDGYVGQSEHKVALAPLLGDRLTGVANLLMKVEPAWSLEGMKPHASTKGEWKWPDVVRMAQSELAAAPEAPLQRSCLERAFFQYVGAGPRRLELRCKAISLLKPNEKLDQPALAKKLDSLAKRLLPDVALDQTAADVHVAATPIYELQKLAAQRKFDGMLFAEAFYDRDGKLTFDGMRGGETKDVKLMIEQHLAKDKKPIAPAGLADLDKLRLSPWQAMLEEMRGKFANSAWPSFTQTRIDRAYFQLDAAGGKPRVRFEGVSLYQVKTPTAEEASAVLAETLKRWLPAYGIAGFEPAVEGLERKANPVIEMQKKANDAGMDGVVFSQIGFDAKGACYVKLPFVPKGQEANIRKLIDEAAKRIRI